MPQTICWIFLLVYPFLCLLLVFRVCCQFRILVWHGSLIDVALVNVLRRFHSPLESQCEAVFLAF